MLYLVCCYSILRARVVSHAPHRPFTPLCAQMSEKPKKIATVLGELTVDDVNAERQERRLKQAALIASKKRETEAEVAIKKKIAALEAELAVIADNKARLDEQLKPFTRYIKIRDSDGSITGRMAILKMGEKERAYFTAIKAAGGTGDGAGASSGDEESK